LEGQITIVALALAESGHFKKLRVIELHGNQIGSRGAAARRKRFGERLQLRTALADLGNVA
jgi:hypothetical protein